MPLTANKLFRVQISDDRLLATLSLNGDVPPANVSAENIISEIQILKIVISQEGTQAISKFADALNQQQVPNPIVIARGTAPEHDQNGRIQKFYEQNKPEAAQSQNDAKAQDSDQGAADTDTVHSQSHYDRSCFVMVKKDQKLIQIMPPVPGSDGQDIYGQTISRKLGREVTIKLGVNVRLEDNVVYSTADGKVECTHDKIWVDEKLEIQGNVDFAVGNIDFGGEVEIRKNVLDLFKVAGRGCVTVHGVIEAAEVKADKDLNAMGGIAGKEKGRCVAGHDVNAKYITNGHVRAGNNITIRSEVVHSDVACGGSITAERGEITGGHIVATGGMKVRNLGSEAGVRTLVEVGVDDDLRKATNEAAATVKTLRNKAAKVRKIVEPLMQNQKYLNSEQKEKATELLYNASELEDEAKKVIDDLRKLYEKSQEKSVAEIEILGTLYPGVTIRFPRLEAVVTTTIAGPVKVVPKKVDGVVRIAAIATSGTGTILDAGSTCDNMWDILAELLELPPE